MWGRCSWEVPKSSARRVSKGEGNRRPQKSVDNTTTSVFGEPMYKRIHNTQHLGSTLDNDHFRKANTFDSPVVQCCFCVIDADCNDGVASPRFRLLELFSRRYASKILSLECIDWPTPRTITCKYSCRCCVLHHISTTSATPCGPQRPLFKIDDNLSPCSLSHHSLKSLPVIVSLPDHLSRHAEYRGTMEK